MIEVRASVEIDRPSGEVFDYLANMSNNPDWQDGMQSCTWTSEPPLRLGSTYDQTARFLGKEIVSSFEVIEFEAGRHIRIETVRGTMPIDVTRDVSSATDGGCTVSALVRGDPTGVFRLAAPLMRRMVSRSVQKDYQQLKERLEMPHGMESSDT